MMSSFGDSLLKEVVKLDCVNQLKVSVANSLKYGSLVGVATVMSGIAGGPIGLAIGGAMSGCIAGYVSYGKYKSVPSILLNETTPEQRNKLSEELFKVVNAKNINTIKEFVFAMNSNKEFTQVIIQLLIMFLSSEMKYKVVA
ncbi:protein C19orf12 homolog [Lasioglossum baleicum]|uniref:protein C19orf12 homolog n=1 Tax=Lasioglossum baleicum TaxID=434251 RepID=UPI003FCDDA85